MPECVFTIFDGPDKGKQFVLRDTPIGIGRDPEREVALNDDRASRFHATLAFDGENVVLVDQDSSNGTFLNGKLIDQGAVKEGDIIAIASTWIVFGTEPPTPERLEELAAGRAVRTRPKWSNGDATVIKPQSAMTVAREEIRALDILEAVADATGPLGESRGISVTVETDPDAGGRDFIYVNRDLLYRALTELLEIFLKELSAADGVLALRLSYDRGLICSQIDILVVSIPIPHGRFQNLEAQGAFGTVRERVRANGGRLHILPADFADLLARIQLPVPPDQAQATIIRAWSSE